jgi:hypothetical protein
MSHISTIDYGWIVGGNPRQTEYHIYPSEDRRSNETQMCMLNAEVDQLLTVDPEKFKKFQK